MLPPYFDRLIAAWQAGLTGRDVHLGYWDTPPALSAPCSPRDFAAAQARLTERIIDQLPLFPGQDILDVACGFGGTLAALNAAASSTALTGINIDTRQLAICRTIPPRFGNRLALIAADACALPLPAASRDHVTCVEALFHFPSRAGFLREAARVLRPDGCLLLTDILLRADNAPWSAERIAAILRRDYGPWPDPWCALPTIIQAARAAGLEPIAQDDWTVATLPSYRVIAPDPAPERDPNPGAGAVFRWLHEHGGLTYQMLGFRRTSR